MGPAPPSTPAIAAIILAVGVACRLLLWRFSYAILPLPLTAGFLAVVLAGRIPAMARYQRHVAGWLAGAPVPSRTFLRVEVTSIAVGPT